VLNLPPFSSTSPLLMAATGPGTNLEYGSGGGLHGFKHEFNYNPIVPPRTSENEYRRGSLLPAADAAGVLAQLHVPRGEISWDQENVRSTIDFELSDAVRHIPMV
jgi:hypothetical protein